MKTLLLLPLLLILGSPGQEPTASEESSSVAVIGFKWFRARQKVEKVDSTATAPAPEMIPANKNFQRTVRANSSAGTEDPNVYTVDGRSAALEKIVREADGAESKPVDGFAYRIKLQNTGTKVIDILFLEYQFIDVSNPANVSRRQFLCGVNMKPQKEKELKAFSLAGPSDVVSVESLADKTRTLKEKVLINRVEYTDGTIWQRKDWKFAEIRLGYAAAMATAWGSEMCRGL